MSSSGLRMDPPFLPRCVWSSDSKILQHPADLHTGVLVTRSIPAGTCFGPCLLQNTFYDTIAFIAQKSCDKRAKSYVFRVDPEVLRNSALLLSWLRLVQAARCREEQNTEAFLKAGQLYVRSTRDIHEEEELLVWYDQELSHLLGFTDGTKAAKQDLKCGRCEQVFKFEYPFLAHCRFLCPQVKSDTWSRETHRKQHRVTDFHNIARDLEHKRPGCNEDAEISSKRRRSEENLHPKWRKTVLLEKTNISNDDNITQLVKGSDQPAGEPSSPQDKLKPDHIKSDHMGHKSEEPPLTGEPREPRSLFTHDGERKVRSEREEACGVISSTNSAFSLVLPFGQGEQKSAFCKPSKRSSPGGSSAPAAAPSRPEEMSEAFSSGLGYGSLISSSILGAELQPVSSPVALGTSFHYAPEHWSRSLGAQLQSGSSLTILPPTFTSFGVSVQNWCAKCNLSFRMTSDLVFHMRSHHKKEFAAESQVRRRREDKLTCPICHEYFRERHHLSRHMTSHN